MTKLPLEERIKALAAKGELVHLSLAFQSTTKMFAARFACASAAAGYSCGDSPDPIEAVHMALDMSPAKKARRPSAKPSKEPDVTAAVISDAEADDLADQYAISNGMGAVLSDGTRVEPVDDDPPPDMSEWSKP